MSDALRNSEPGDIIRMHEGRYPGLTLGFSSSSKFNADDVSDVDLCAAEGEAAVITPYTTSATEGGDTIAVLQKTPIQNIRFWDIEFEAGYRSGVIFGSHGDGEMIHHGFEFHNCVIDGGWDHATDSGRKSKWGILSYRLSDFVFERGRISNIEKEHAFYHHNVAGDVTIRDMVSSRLGRTFLQVVQRKNEGPIGFGTVLVENVTVEDCGLADGGSCLTIAGHADTTIYRNVTVKGGHSSDLSGKKVRGAMVAWTPGGDNFWEGVYQNGTVIMEENTFDFINGDRSLVSLAGAETLVLKNNTFRSSNGKQVAFDPKGTGSTQDNAPDAIEACGNTVEGAKVECKGGDCPFDMTEDCP